MQRWAFLGVILVVAGCDKAASSGGADRSNVNSPGQAGMGQGHELDLRTRSMFQLRQIGEAYQKALKAGEGFFNALVGGCPPAGPDDLLPYLPKGRATLTSPRDGQPFVLLWRVRPEQQLHGLQETLLGWEATADRDGGRCVLYCSGFPAYVKADQFAALQRAQPEGDQP